MKVLTIVNQKGGVGKTTLAINLSAALALMLSKERENSPGRVLLVDLDAQAHASTTLAGGVFEERVPTSETDEYAQATLGELMLGESQLPLLSVIKTSRIPENGSSNLDYIPTLKSKMNIAGKLLENEADGLFRLVDLLEEAAEAYEYIVIDTPPSLRVMTVNSMIAASHAVIPVSLKAFSMDSLDDVLASIKSVQSQRRMNPNLRVLGIQPSMCNFQRSEQNEWLDYLAKQYDQLVLPAIADRADVSYAQSEGLDIFSFYPPRKGDELASSNLAAQEFARSAEEVRRRLDQ